MQRSSIKDFIPYNPKLKEYARQNRQNPTSAERKIWQILRAKQFAHLKFTRQKPLLTFIADFYCAELSLVIEVDGDSHANQERYDKLRSDILKKRFGIEALRFNNSDVLDNLEGVYDSIERYIKMREAQKIVFKTHNLGEPLHNLRREDFYPSVN